MIDDETRRRDTAMSIWYGTIEEAEQKGRQEGREEERKTMLKTFLTNGVDPQMLSQLSGIPLPEIQKLSSAT